MKQIALFSVLISLYIAVLFPFTAYMQNKPFAEKLGYVPQPEVLKLISADQKQLTAASLIMKVLFYFGTLVEKTEKKIFLPADYPGMSRTIHVAVKLDPYNTDAYYFAQAILVWDVRQIRIANDLLEYGMKYRDWDFYLPLFAGFNYAYFLKDFEKAAQYYKKAGDLTGDELYVNLAGRYMHESGQTDHAIAYLTAMEKSAKNEAIRKSFGIRLNALKETRRVEKARDEYLEGSGKLPASIDELLRKGYLKEQPVDPYGGKFYIDGKGQVRSTSKFAFGAGSSSR